MDIRQLEAYVYTVKYRSFSLAAQKLYLSQPTVSAHICNLEKELHTQLLKRTTKTLSVTPAGQTLYNYAAEILDLRHKAILELSNEQETMLHIGVSSVPSLYLLPELLAAYHEKTPEIRFRTSCSDSLDVINKVADSTCDIGLVGDQLRIFAGRLGRAGNRSTEHTAFSCLSKPAGPADSTPARTVPAARGQLGHQAGNTVFPSKSRSVA